MAKKKEAKLPEYRVYFTSVRDETSQTNKTLLTVETTRVFRSFQYALTVREQILGNAFRLFIDGISVKPLTIPKIGSAVVERELPALKGVWDFYITNFRKETSHFRLKFSKKGIEILLPPTKRFLELAFE
ncbi:MAG: hypothetical protein FJ218_08460 [Ignavibacteria bacterium]|nr:hypothetical protein [Ignavibacteria bacterium]